METKTKKISTETERNRSTKIQKQGRKENTGTDGKIDRQTPTPFPFKLIINHIDEENKREKGRKLIIHSQYKS